MLTRDTSALGRAREERGGVLAWFALWLPVLILFAALAVDVANWFEHKRHLQMQADAAALAGAGKFRLPFALCSDAEIKNEARLYAGDHLDGSESLVAATTNFNDQVGGTPASRLHALINFSPGDPTRFWRSASDDDGATGPCAARYIDVRLTETDLPWFFGLPPSVVDWIDARARVELRQIGTMTGMLPIAVPDVDPKAVTATFRNECTGADIVTTSLSKQAALDSGLVVWANNGTGLPGDPGAIAVSMPTNCTRVGVRIALSASTSTSTSCTHPLVDCVDLQSANGILLVRSYPTTPAGTASAPQVRSVELVPASTGCADPYFFSLEKPCGSIGVRANIDFGGSIAGVQKVEARYNNKNPWSDLTFNTTTGLWQTSGTPFGTGGDVGPLGIQLRWKGNDVCKSGGGCDLEGGNPVHRAFGAVDNRSGPVRLIQTFDAGGAQLSSAAAGTSPNLIVRIALLPNLQTAAGVSDPPVALRVFGNQNQALNCDLDYTNLSDEFAYGCGQKLPDSPFSEAYTQNDGSLNCRSTNRTTLWNMQTNNQSDPAWKCVALKTGHSPNEIAQGLNQRIFGNDKPLVCPPAFDDPASPGQLGHNNWSMYDTGLPEGDPRIVQVVLSPFGAFSGSGNDETIPVTGFATFYITGYTGQGSGFNNPCEGNGDDPVPGGDSGLVVGHFINYIDKVNSGASDLPCDGVSLTPCVAVLTD